MQWSYGDSTSTGFSDTLAASLNAIVPTVGPVVADKTQEGGLTAAGQAARVVADLAARGENYRWVLITIGSNDLDSANDVGKQAQFEGDLGTTLDAIHAKWVNALVYVARPWRRNYMAEANIISGFIANVVTARSPWAGLGPDARVWMENGDDGTTLTVEGVHPNAAGYLVAATEWQTVLGY